ncbi:11318_t:CDS:2 [Dentiscutata erythropus]|uniref:11318_t:CDS:1 n=1 Tax=Dentiscutata erythropus TaxID=1348616 RepID=A0A9N8WCX5_9GLOM|nr:11318_t:CDS:2 [Dentiscutata erythropus]
MTFEKHNTTNNETQNCANEVEQPLNKIIPTVKFLPENIIWDGNVDVTNIDWTVLNMEPSTGLPTYPTSEIDFSDGKISERDIQWPDNNNKPIVINDNIEFSDKSIVINDDNIELSDKSNVINDDIEFSDKSIVTNDDDIESSDKSIVTNDDDIESSDKSIVTNDDNDEYLKINFSKLEWTDKFRMGHDDIESSDKSINSAINPIDKSNVINGDDIESSDKSNVINGDDIEFSDKSNVINGDDIEFSEINNQFKEMCTQAESYNSIDELYGGLNIPDYANDEHVNKHDEHVNEANGWVESSHTVRSNHVIDQKNSISNGIHYESRSHYTVSYTRRRRRPRSYLEQRKDPRYNPDTDHWMSDATFLSFHDQERIDPLKRENEKHDAVIQAALDAWSANKDVTMEVFKTKPTKDTRSISEIFDDDDRGDIVPPVVSYNQTLPLKELSISKSPIIPPQTRLYQALYEGNIAQANSVAKYLDRFKIDLSPILSIKLPDDIEIEVRQNSKWPAYYVDADKTKRRYSCEETIKKALHHIIHSRVAIINAAPVTSEVLLITKAVQLLSEPLIQRYISAPIIVITKSSLTLDKILVELLSNFPNLIRVGSTKQCKNRLLAGRQVDNLQNEISTLYNRQIDHLKDTRIDLLKRIKERFTFMSDDYFLQSAPSQFQRQLIYHKGKKTISPSRDVELKALKAWLSNDYPSTSTGSRSPTALFEESTIRRPFKCCLNKSPLQKILSANMDNLFNGSPDDHYSKITLPFMFSVIEELENILSFDDDTNELNNIYSSNIDELQFINNLISHLPQDQVFLFNKKNQPEKFPNDLKNDITQFWRHINITNIWKMPTSDRKLYRHMFNRIISNYYDPIITNIYTSAMKLNSTMDVKRLKKLSDVMKGAPVIGFSWKNAKCLKKLFHDSSPASTPVFIIDEASEIPEDEISCIIHNNEDLEHLVMIGDMVRSCGKSLFERWILNGGRHYRLSEQSRVHPNINDLLSPFYKRISDDLSFLKNNSNILGTTSNIYFLNHQNYDEVPDGISKKMINTIEAEFVTKFAFYLYQQDADFDPGNITILTPFVDQKELIKSLLSPELTKEKTVKIREIITKEIGMRNYEKEFAQKIIVTEKKLGTVNVRLINDYRYEENQIVILSLVAVPQRLQQDALATLRTKDLVYTALSRANRGLYIFGDGDVLKNIQLWNTIIKKTMDELILSCQNHGVQTKISHPNHFDQYVPLGGCMVNILKYGMNQ